MPKVYKCENCNQLFEPGMASLPHSKGNGNRCVSVLIIKSYFTDEDIQDGDIDYRRIDFEAIDCLPDDFDFAEGITIIDLAVKAIEEAGCGGKDGYSGSQFNTGGWYTDPEGSHITDYYSGMRCETSAHLYGFTDAEQELVYALVTKK